MCVLFYWIMIGNLLLINYDFGIVGCNRVFVKYVSVGFFVCKNV